MTQDRDSKGKTSELRKLAESTLADKAGDAADISSLSAEELQKLVHELRLRQSELEMQKEELQRAQEKVQSSEELLRKFFEISVNYCYMVSSQGVIFDANASALKTLGYERDELIGQSVVMIYAPESHARAREVFENWKRTGRVENEELVILTKSGQRRTVLLNASAHKSDRGLLSVSVQTDITERKRAEERLRKGGVRANLLLGLYKKAPEMTDKELYGYALDQAVQLTDSAIGFFHLVSDDQKTIILTTWNSEALKNCTASYATHYPVEQAGNWVDCVRLKRPIIYNDFPASPNRKGFPEGHTPVRRFMSIPVFDGEKVRIIFGVGNKAEEYDDYDVRQIELVASELQKILKQRRSDAELRESEAKLVEAQRIAHIGYWERDLDSGLHILSDEACRIFGQQPQKRVFKANEWHERWLRLLHPDDRSRTAQAFDNAVEGGPRYDVEYRIVWPEGEVRTVHSFGEVTRDESGRPRRILGTMQDITERKRAEEQLGRLFAAVEHAGEAILVTDSAGSILYVNPAFESTTGYDRQEVIGKNPRILQSGKQDDAFYQHMWDTLLSGQVWRGRFTNKRKDGTLYEETATISYVKDEGGNVVNYVAVKRDVTDESLLQRQLIQAQKMEAIGTLAGGIAHDFNNLLQVINGYAEMALFSIKEGDVGYSALLEIRRAAHSAAELTQGLLTFSRRVESKLRPVDLNQELQEVAKMLARTLPKMIEIEMDLFEPLDPVNSDPAQLQQVVINLAVNARDAMPNGGRLSIETKNVYLDEEYCKSHLDVSPGNYVLLSMSDSGTGMNEETTKHIFDPFFTTKETGKGTGLGLSIVFGVVRSHGGNIQFYSEPGHGTIFKIYLPALRKTHDVAETPQFAAYPGGNETILLVDDEESVRRLATEILKSFGYTVLTASDGKECVEVFSRERGRIDLLILDLIMPEMGGTDCLKEILKIAPETRVIIASGYVANGQIDQALDMGAKCFVTKPYDARQLLERVRKALDET